MEFTVPQFIEKEPKIFGPFTFKQFVFIGIAGGTSILLYFMLPFSVFLLVAIFLLGGAFALAFLRIEGASLPTVIKNALVFLGRPKIYLWRKKSLLPKIVKTEKLREESEEESILKITKKSHLRDLFTHLETRAK